MASVLEELILKMSADSAELRSELDKASSRSKKFEKDVSSGFANVAKAAVAVGAAAAAGLSVLAKNAINSADEIGKMAQKTGFSTEALSQLKHATDLAGISFESFTKGLGRSARIVKDAAGGLDSAKRPFEQLDIAIKNTDGTLRSTEAVLGDVADRFSKMANGTAKAALAQEIFGRSGTELIPLLNQGRAGLAEMRAEADKLGLTVSGPAAAAAEQFNDNLTRLGAAFKGVINQGIQPILPLLAQMTDETVRIAKESGVLQTAIDGVIVVFKSLLTGGVLIKGVFEALGNVIGGVTASLTMAAKGEFKSAWETLKSIPSEANVEFQEAATSILDIWMKTEQGFGRTSAAMAQSAEDTFVAVDDKTSKTVAKAVSALATLSQQLNQDVAIFGQSATQVMRYRLEIGDLADEVSQAGPAGEAFARSILPQSAALEKLNEQADSMKEAKSGLENIQNSIAAIFDENLNPLERINQTFDTYRTTLEEIATLEPTLKAEVDATIIAMEQAKQMQLTALEVEGNELRMEDERKALEERFAMLEEFTGLRRETVQNMHNFEKLSGIQQMQTAAQLGSQLFGLLAAHSKKAFQLQKAFGIAKAIINTHVAITEALKLPWPLNIAAAAIVAAKGFAQVQAIRSSQPGGGVTSSSLGGAGGVGGFNTTTPEGREVDNQQARPTQQVHVTINGTAGIFPESSIRALIGRINDSVGDGVAITVST